MEFSLSRFQEIQSPSDWTPIYIEGDIDRISVNSALMFSKDSIMLKGRLTPLRFKFPLRRVTYIYKPLRLTFK